MSETRRIDRREFLKGSAVAAAGAAVLGMAAPSALGANERVNVATIGCGGMGHAHIGTLVGLRDKGLVNIVAVCDVWDKRLDSAVSLTRGMRYRDYRYVLDRKDVDVVTIATPDHWHAPITIDALNAGKDVYCEKPMTYWGDLSLPKRVVEAVARNRRVMQVGTQGMSDSIWEQASERIKAGAIGKLMHAQSGDMRNGPIGLYEPASNDPDAKPGVNLDWDLWLGPAPKRPWDHGRYFAFRSFWDYSGGTGTDFFPHNLTPLLRAMGLTFPHRVSASGGLYALKDGREVPDIFSLTIEYPDGPSVLLMSAVGCSYGIPTLIRGHEATMTFDGPGAVIHPDASLVGEKPEEQIQRQRGASLEEHFTDLLGCVKTRNKPRSNEVFGYHVMTALHMGIRAYRDNAVYEFDPVTETVRRG